MKEKKKPIDQLKIIIEKFLSFEPDSKNYSFVSIKTKEDQWINIENPIRLDEFIEITLNILDTHNDKVQLYAQVSDDDDFFITDDGFIAEEFSSAGKEGLFSNHLELYCKLDEFDTKIQDYFYMLSTLFNFLGFNWYIKNEQEEILSKNQKS